MNPSLKVFPNYDGRLPMKIIPQTWIHFILSEIIVSDGIWTGQSMISSLNQWISQSETESKLRWTNDLETKFPNPAENGPSNFVLLSNAAKNFKIGSAIFEFF